MPIEKSLFSDDLPPCIPAVRARAASDHQAAVDGFDRLWRETRGEPYAWRPIDFRFVKLGLKLAGSVDAWLERARGLLHDPPSTWYIQEASPQLLYTRWPQLATRARPLSRDQRNLLALRRAALEL